MTLKRARACMVVAAVAYLATPILMLGSGAPFDAQQASSTLNQQGTRTGAAAPALKITSPANLTVVAPGDTVTVKVTSPANTRFQAVELIAEEPLTAAALAATETLPAQFSFKIPNDICCRKYGVTAFGVTPAGQEFSDTILIGVERRDMPASVEPRVWEVDLEEEGESDQIRLLGRFADDVVLEVTESTRATYASRDPNVATVDARGVITAVAEGETNVVATYGPPASGVRAEIYVNVAPARLSVAPRTIAFGNKAVGTTSTQQMTVTNVVSNDRTSITKVTVSPGYSETDNCLRSSPLSPGASCVIAVTFAPTSTGPGDGVVSLETSFYHLPLVFKLSGTGVSR